MPNLLAHHHLVLLCSCRINVTEYDKDVICFSLRQTNPCIECPHPHHYPYTSLSTNYLNPTTLAFHQPSFYPTINEVLCKANLVTYFMPFYLSQVSEIHFVRRGSHWFPALQRHSYWWTEAVRSQCTNIDQHWADSPGIFRAPTTSSFSI